MFVHLFSSPTSKKCHSVCSMDEHTAKEHLQSHCVQFFSSLPSKLGIRPADSISYRKGAFYRTFLLTYFAGQEPKARTPHYDRKKHGKGTSYTTSLFTCFAHLEGNIRDAVSWLKITWNRNIMHDTSVALLYSLGRKCYHPASSSKVRWQRNNTQS